MQIARPTAPHDARWSQITDNILTSSEGDEIRRLADSFEPTSHDEGHEHARWLCDALGEPPVDAEIHVLRNDNALLGFFVVESALVKVSYRVLPVMELYRRITRRGLQPSLMLSSIARSATTDPGFGHALFEHAVGIAVNTAENVAIVVDPVNQRVARLWKDDYDFRPMLDAEAPGRLYFPLGDRPEPKWP